MSAYLTAMLEAPKRDVIEQLLAAKDRIRELKQENAALNSAAQMALAHVEELREAWVTGALSERDGLGGTRSNRNVDVESALRQSLDRGKRPAAERVSDGRNCH